MKCYFPLDQEDKLVQHVNDGNLPGLGITKHYTAFLKKELYLEISTLDREDLELLLKLGVQRISHT